MRCPRLSQGLLTIELIELPKEDAAAGVDADRLVALSIVLGPSRGPVDRLYLEVGEGVMRAEKLGVVVIRSDAMAAPLISTALGSGRRRDARTKQDDSATGQAIVEVVGLVTGRPVLIGLRGDVAVDIPGRVFRCSVGVKDTDLFVARVVEELRDVVLPVPLRGHPAGVIVEGPILYLTDHGAQAVTGVRELGDGEPLATQPVMDEPGPVPPGVDLQAHQVQRVVLGLRHMLEGVRDARPAVQAVVLKESVEDLVGPSHVGLFELNELDHVVICVPKEGGLIALGVSR